jgi:hypothetical protein
MSLTWNLDWLTWRTRSLYHTLHQPPRYVQGCQPINLNSLFATDAITAQTDRKNISCIGSVDTWGNVNAGCSQRSCKSLHSICSAHFRILCSIVTDGPAKNKLTRVGSRVTLCGETPIRWSPSWTRRRRHRLLAQASLMPNSLVGDPPSTLHGKSMTTTVCPSSPTCTHIYAAWTKMHTTLNNQFIFLPLQLGVLHVYVYLFSPLIHMLCV